MKDGINLSELDWVQLKTEMDGSPPETTLEKMKRKLAENPFIILGSVVTVGALGYGLFNFYRGRRQMQQYMMRLRVGAQMFTVLAAVGGILMTLPKEKRNLSGLIEKGNQVAQKK